METKYTFNRDGVPEEVAVERWAWGVVYDDDTEFHQFGADGVFHQFKEIEQDRVKMFTMYEVGGEGRVDMPVKNVQIFHFYRNLMLDQGTDDARTVRVYVFGWKDAETGATSYNYILPDDRIISADHDVAHLTAYNV